MFALLHHKHAHKVRFSEMPGVVLRTLTAQSPSCWSAPLSCCESMPCALDSCTKTNLVDFHNYYNLIINPLVWTPHRTVWQRSHASCWEMQQDCVLTEKVLHQAGDYTLCCVTGKQNSALRLFIIIRCGFFASTPNVSINTSILSCIIPFGNYELKFGAQECFYPLEC